jgi:hypothetical protein
LYPRVLAGLFLLMFAGFLTSASGNPRPRPRVHAARPSNFDYLVLASIADSPHVLVMASYRPAARPRVPARPGKPHPQLADD